HHLLARVRRPAPLDEVQRRVHLVGPVHREVERGGARVEAVEAEVVEGGEGDAVPPREALGGERRRHADDAEPLLAHAAPERRDGEGGRGAGAEPQPHPVLYEGRRGLAGGALGALAVAHGRWEMANGRGGLHLHPPSPISPIPTPHPYPWPTTG